MTKKNELWTDRTAAPASAPLSPPSLFCPRLLRPLSLFTENARVHPNDRESVQTRTTHTHHTHAQQAASSQRKQREQQQSRATERETAQEPTSARSRGARLPLSQAARPAPRARRPGQRHAALAPCPGIEPGLESRGERDRPLFPLSGKSKTAAERTPLLPLCTKNATMSTAIVALYVPVLVFAHLFAGFWLAKVFLLSNGTGSFLKRKKNAAGGLKKGGMPVDSADGSAVVKGEAAVVGMSPHGVKAQIAATAGAEADGADQVVKLGESFSFFFGGRERQERAKQLFWLGGLRAARRAPASPLSSFPSPPKPYPIPSRAPESTSCDRLRGRMRRQRRSLGAGFASGVVGADARRRRRRRRGSCARSRFSLTPLSPSLPSPSQRPNQTTNSRGPRRRRVGLPPALVARLVVAGPRVGHGQRGTRPRAQSPRRARGRRRCGRGRRAPAPGRRGRPRHG